MGTFKSGRITTQYSDAAACIGVTPIQHSSGGKTQLGSIGKNVKNSLLRSYLITGAMSVVSKVDILRCIKREPKTAKEQWLNKTTD